MDELRMVRREDRSLIVATESGEEYRLLVDETVLAELRHLGRPPRGPNRVNPREVQALVRAGKSREEIAEATGLDDADIERYEEPVLAERRYVLELAHAVPVRTSPGDEGEQQFGTVIAERLIALSAERAEWRSWRDEEAGWMIGLDFDSHDVAHRAVWAFEHRKGQLSPITPDAETLSKQGEVGDRLIPKLRAVDADERFDSGAFDPERLTPAGEDGDEDADAAPLTNPVSPDHPSTGSIPVLDADAEYARRQHIEERAIKTPAPELPELGQTADLLDALRKRRGERDASAPREEPAAPPLRFPGVAADDDDADDDTAEVEGLWAADGRDGARRDPEQGPGQADDDAATPKPRGKRDEEKPADEKVADEKSRRGKGRAAIPSWDDILFGTRSDEDPA